MRILCIGGAGFIGSHLCDTLLTEGNEVICLDNLITGNKNNLNSILYNKNFKFFVGDAWETGQMEYACSHMPVDQIYYLASIASPKKYVEFPLETIDANVGGFRNALEVATKWGSRILYTSTSEVYGDPEEYPQKEEYNGNVNCTTDRAVYDESKRLGETLAFLFNRKYGTDAVVVRIFNTYGPRMAVDDGRVVPAFINAALDDVRPVIYGDGEQTRSFCYIDDMIRGLCLAMTKGDIGPLNLGDDKENYSIKELWELIQEITDCQREPKFEPHFTSNDPVERCPDIRLAKHVLKWKPKTKITDGLIKTMEYFQNV